jgi:hypothetical protein
MSDNNTPIIDEPNSAAALAEPAVRSALGSGVMGARSADEAPNAQREALEHAARDARSSGHRFDLLRYLRLRRSRDRGHT